MSRRPGAPSRATARTGIVCAALALGAERASSQVDAGFEPVPAANISEETLRVPEENFSVRAPGPQWDWLRDNPAKASSGRSYLCRNLRTGERFLLTVTPPGTHGDAYAEDWLARIRTAQEAQSRELVGTRSEASDVPAPGSLRLSTMITAPGTTIYFTGYVLGADRVYAFQHYSDAARESPVFTAFARSFALLTPSAAAGRSPFGGLAVLAAAGALAVVLIAIWAFGRPRKGRPASR
jgi:hypothetical protein